MRQETRTLIEGDPLSKGAQTLVRAPGEMHLKVLSELLEGQVSKGGRRAVLLSTHHPYTVLLRKLPMDKLPKGGLKVLDAISMGYGTVTDPQEGFVFLQTPATLESMLAAIERVNREKGSFELLVIDSLDIFRSRFPLKSAVEFFRILQVRMAEKDVTFFVLDRSKDAPSELFFELSSMIDGSLDLSKGGGPE